MARRTVVTLIDDLDGISEAHETVTFAIDSVWFEIDLNAEHAEELRDTVEDFSGAARRLPTHVKGTTRR